MCVGVLVCWGVFVFVCVCMCVRSCVYVCMFMCIRMCRCYDVLAL